VASDPLTTVASDPLTTSIQQSTLLGQFSATTAGFLSSSGALNAPSAVGLVDPTNNSGSDNVSSQLSGGQLMTDLTTIGSLAGISTSGSSQPTSGVATQVTPVAGADVALGQPDNSASSLANPSQLQGRHGPGA
jgi:hypothetical protein